MKTNIILSILLVLSLGYVGANKYTEYKKAEVNRPKCFKSENFDIIYFTFNAKDKIHTASMGFNNLKQWILYSILPMNIMLSDKEVSCPKVYGATDSFMNIVDHFGIKADFVKNAKQAGLL